MCGTNWVAKGYGENLNTLRKAVGIPTIDNDRFIFTNLKLNGNPLTPYDKKRVESLDESDFIISGLSVNLN